MQIFQDKSSEQNLEQPKFHSEEDIKEEKDGQMVPLPV